MTWAARLRLMFGLVVVLAVVAACTLVFNQRQSRADSTSAMLVAQEYTIGSAYPGTITEQLVDPGDVVAAGATMFRVRSTQLARDLASESVTAAELGITAELDGTFDVVATVDGTVGEISTPVGDFAQGGEQLATLERTGTLAVVAEFTLSARDYGRVAPGSVVTLMLPTDETVQGRVTTIDVETVEGTARSKITVESAALAKLGGTGITQPGTPVRATLELRDDGPLAGVADSVRDFFRKIGL